MVSGVTEAGANDPLRDLLIECLDRFEHEGEAGLEALCRHHPEHAETLRRRVAKLAGMGFVEAPEGSRYALPERLGDFRLLQRLGSGGMGVVYLAEQISLKREVALKLVRPDQLYFPEARLRFAREVETVAKLQHPGIVPVYAVGIEGDVSFFAMERVLGCGLDEVLEVHQEDSADQLTGADFARTVRECSSDDAADSGTSAWLFSGSWEAVCLRVIRLVAEALDHAHGRGVLHRDVKPSNIMITPSGRVMLVDFGLASADGAASMTRPGSQIGSLPYMAPEQVRGDKSAIGQHTDVYAAGVTLYELLALRQAFDGTATAEVIAAIQRGAASRLRGGNRGLSWEAETVCLTAMDVDPSRRYQRAADLARDLGNVLDSRPIEARRASVWRRGRRLAQRHPAATSALAVAALAVVAGPTALLLQERAAGARVRIEKANADTNLATALEAIESMLARVGGLDLRGVPGAELVRVDLLQDASNYLEGFFARGYGGAELELRAGRCSLRLGLLLRNLNQWERATAAFAAAMPRIEKLADAHPSAAPTQVLLSETLHGRAVLHLAQREYDRALQDLNRAQQILDDVLQGEPARADWAAVRAITMIDRGRIYDKRGQLAAAEAELTEAGAWIDKSLRVHPADPTLRRQSVGVLLRLGDLYSDSTRVDQARAAYRQAIPQAEALASGVRKSVERSQLGALLQNLAGLESSAGDPTLAAGLYGRAIEVRRELVRDFPRTPAHASHLAKVLISSGNHSFNQGDRDAREACHREAELLLVELLRDDPENADHAAHRGFILLGRGVAAATQGDGRSAVAYFRETADLLGPIVRTNPDVAFYRRMLCNAYLKLLAALGRQPYTAVYAETAAAAAELAQLCPRDWRDYGNAAKQLVRAATTCLEDAGIEDSERAAARQRYLARAEATLRAAVAAGYTKQVVKLLDRYARAQFADARFAALGAELGQ